VTGVAVTVAAPPEAAIPVSDGIEKNVASHAAGAVNAIAASLVNVTVSGLLALPLGPTVRAVVSVCALPEEPVAKVHETRLVDVEQPVWPVPRPEVVKPGTGWGWRW
jgi:hypothetical protein